MKVLLSIDDSAHSKLALDSVLSRPWADNTEFMVFTVVEPYHPDNLSWDPNTISESIQFEQRTVETSKKLVQDAAVQLKEQFKHCKVNWEAREGKVLDSIIQKASAWRADLIIMGSHGRKGFQKFLLGSISQAVVAQALCSVEIIKQPKY